MVVADSLTFPSLVPGSDSYGQTEGRVNVKVNLHSLHNAYYLEYKIVVFCTSINISAEEGRGKGGVSEAALL